MMAESHPRPAPEAIRTLFEARHIAIIGASADQTKLGSSPINAMGLLGYKGTISVVHPRNAEMLGHRCYPSVADLPDGVEAAMIIVPAATAIELAEQCVAKGILSLVIISQGFGEAGGEGLERDQRLMALVRDHGAAITGPNSNGLANVPLGLAPSIAPIFQYADRVKPGGVSVISQSGAMVSSLLSRFGQNGLGIAKYVTCGNELVLGAADYLDFLVDDPETQVIAIYLETIRKMAPFKAALERARDAGKPVVAIKVGESESGQKAALSHTGAIAGSYRNTIAFLESEGVYVADDLETMAAIAECLIRYDWPNAETAKPFIASISGGFAAQTADVMARLGMPLCDPSAQGVAELSALPTQSHAVNPYDIAAQNALIPEIIDIFRRDGFNQLLFGLVLLKPEINEQVATMLVEAKARGMDTLFAISPQVDPAERERFNAAGIMVTDMVEPLIKALRAIDRHHARARLRKSAQAEGPGARLSLPARSGLLDEAQSKGLLTQAGFRVPASAVMPVGPHAGDHAHLHKPVVMKGLSDKIAHKTEHGLVALGLRDDHAIAEAWGRMCAALAVADRQADSILVEEMIDTGLEAILGVQRDATVGPVVVVGAGGILVELLDDAVVLIPPFSPAEAEWALSGTRFGRLLTGYRGRRYDMATLAQVASALGNLALAEPRLESLDINPLLVQPLTNKPDSGGLVALDAKIVLGGGPPIV